MRLPYQLFIIPILFCTIELNASTQIPDYIIFKGDTIITYNLLLEQYFRLQGKEDKGSLFGLSFREGASSICWRGYQAIYQATSDSLFLTAITRCGERWEGAIDKSASDARIRKIFKEKVVNDRVFIDWFSGDISFPLTDKVMRWDGVFYKIFEREKVIGVSAGKITKLKSVENYVDARRRIDRRYKTRIAPLLFEKIRKAQWMNRDSCDCSEAYLVTINGKGKVSAARMDYTPEEIAEFFDGKDYEYCISNLLRSLRKMRFDIIRDKGKPKTEVIKIDILFNSDGEIEDWTR